MMNHRDIFEAAFADLSNTAITIPPADVNKIIQCHYIVDDGFTYTRTQLWEMERCKAHHPDKYLRHILRPNSLKIFHVKKEGNIETFTRVSDQRLWIDAARFTTVIEQVCLNHHTQQAFFIGMDETTTPEGETIKRGQEQPRFHVEHAVTGTETKPLNIWRIVHMDQDATGEMRKAFREMAESPFLREFNEVFIREDLGRTLTRQEKKQK